MTQLVSDIDKPLEIVLENEPDRIERENKGDEFRSSANETTLVSGNTCGPELEQVLSVAQGEGRKPLSLLGGIHFMHIHIFLQQKNLVLKW